MVNNMTSQKEPKWITELPKEKQAEMIALRKKVLPDLYTAQPVKLYPVFDRNGKKVMVSVPDGDCKSCDGEYTCYKHRGA
jgi:hypothetical protein